MELRILPGNVANMIAAGEVVQRPSSVVKELMENSLDAGADRIAVAITDAGRTLIQVIDNGTGMSPDEAVLCFERHATSKIATPEDLGHILTFGFRGEALASIAAVAEVTLRTRREEDETGVEVVFSASSQVSLKEVQAPRGANFAVRNLFFNVPARRKFLKSDQVEFRHIVEEFTRVALTRPEVGFTLTHNGRDIMVLKPVKSLKFRIQDVLGGHLAGELLDIAAETTIVSVRGFIGRPDTSKKTLGNQFFFVNGRFFRSPYLHKAVMNAYQPLIPEGVTPSYIIFLEVDPATVDVNIHPTKTEVKFEEESVLFQTLYACIKEALGQNSFAGSLEFDNPDAAKMPVLGTRIQDIKPFVGPSGLPDSGYDPFSSGTFADPFAIPPHGGDGAPSGRLIPPTSWAPPVHEATGGHAVREGVPSPPDEISAPWYRAEGSAPEKSASPADGEGPTKWEGLLGGTTPCASARDVMRPSALVDKSQNYGALFEDRVVTAQRLIVVAGRYIIAPSGSGAMIINIRRARERLLYDRFLKALKENSRVSQTALFPVQVRIGAANLPIFEENAGLLASLGFDITPFGADTIVVNGLPEGFDATEGKVETLIGDIMTILAEDRSALPGVLESAMAEKFARLGAATGEQGVSPLQAQRIMEALLSSSNPEFTSSGKRIIQILSTDELDKRF